MNLDYGPLGGEVRITTANVEEFRTLVLPTGEVVLGFAATTQLGYRVRAAVVEHGFTFEDAIAKLVEALDLLPTEEHAVRRSATAQLRHEKTVAPPAPKPDPEPDEPEWMQ